MRFSKVIAGETPTLPGVAKATGFAGGYLLPAGPAA